MRVFPIVMLGLCVLVLLRRNREQAKQFPFPNVHISAPYIDNCIAVADDSRALRDTIFYATKTEQGITMRGWCAEHR